eukprot:sb/3473723/
MWLSGYSRLNKVGISGFRCTFLAARTCKGSAWHPDYNRAPLTLDPFSDHVNTSINYFRTRSPNYIVLGFCHRCQSIGLTHSRFRSDASLALAVSARELRSEHWPDRVTVEVNLKKCVVKLLSKHTVVQGSLGSKCFQLKERRGMLTS